MNTLWIKFVLLPLCSIYSLSFLSPSRPADRTDTQVSCLSYIPEAISPNGDGINDVFTAEFTCPPMQYRLQIFDAQGALVFDTRSHTRAWDGTHEGRPVAEGYYRWELTHFDGHKPERRRGEVVLIR
ncbi:MAG: hypothetical protein OHK0039_44090 [Bacteroidia bacterium]